MEFKTSSRGANTRPVARPAQTQTAPLVTRRAPKRRLLLVLAGLAALLLVAAICFISQMVFSAEASIKKDRYQALFMTNGQLYFGKLSNVEGRYVTMQDVFYLQTQQQAGAPKDVAEAEAQAQVLLTKLGSELQGPEDTMYISREQVLFWENLRADSKIVKAIGDFKAKK